MADASLVRLKINRRSGAEPFHEAGHPASFDVLDFWRWSASDLVTNITRGVLAEHNEDGHTKVHGAGVRSLCSSASVHQ
jgi:hypothetical protein